MKTLLSAALLLCPWALAQDASLEGLRATLTALRPHRDQHRETRGATAELTAAKHQLRDWIESGLMNFLERGDEAKREEQIHAALRDAQLLCEGDCFSLDSTLGYLDEVHLRREREFLIVQTSVGIWCGNDDSAYVYQWTASHWQRVWEVEQDIYTKKRYLPQTLHALEISDPDPQGRRLILTLGAKPGCSSAFLPIYYRAFQWTAPAPPKLLVDRAEVASQASFPPVTGTVKPASIRLEFTAGGTGYGFGHQAVRRFELRRGRMHQTDPWAPSPRDFVEEWLAATWIQAAPLAESPALETWHRKFHRDDGMGDFPDPTLPCRSDPNLWQVGLKQHDSPEKTYYLVRSIQPERFTLANISAHAFADCTEPAP